jgi:hypothetical protein
LIDTGVALQPVSATLRTRWPDIANIRRLLSRPHASPASVKTVCYIAIRVWSRSTISGIMIPTHLAVAAVIISPISTVHKGVAVVIEKVVIDIQGGV